MNYFIDYKKPLLSVLYIFACLCMYIADNQKLTETLSGACKIGSNQNNSVCFL